MNRARLLRAGLAGISVAVVGCSGSGPASRGTNQADSVGDAADTSCEIVLREMGQSTIDGGEVYVDSNNVSWVVYRGDIDVDTNLLGDGVTVGVWYQGTLGQTTVQATPSSDATQGIEDLNGGLNPPAGYTRFAFATTGYTTEAGDDQLEPMQIIPFVQFPDGHRLFDHNRTSGNYQMDSSHYAIFDDFSVCPAPEGSPPPPTSGS
jgi:hypothetical protein